MPLNPVPCRRCLALAVGAFLAFATARVPALAQATSEANGSAVPEFMMSGGSAAAAVLAAQRSDWTTAETLAYESGDAVAIKLVKWLRLSQPDGILSFAEVADFVEANPEWPNQTALRKRAEETLSDGYSPELVARWFERFPPMTSNGRRQYAAALTALGPSEAQRAAVRDAWIKGTFSESEEATFLADHALVLTSQDHALRADRLLWEGNTQAAQRLLDRLSGSDRAVVDSRIRLKRNQVTPAQLSGRMPEAVRNHPGLVFDEVQWYRRNGQPTMAVLRLAEVPGEAEQAKRFWDERAILSRQALMSGDAAAAYRVAAGHGLEGGADLAEAEWFAGWVAMRSLGDPAIAARHFDRVADTAKMPISHARGAYWAGRAREAAGQPSEAAAWYQRASQFPTTFYGQLAGAAMAPGAPLPLPADPEVSDEDRARFDTHELKRAADILAAAGRDDLFRTFVVRLAEVLPTAGGRRLAADYASTSGRLEVGVAVAKRAVRDGQYLVASGYPTLMWNADASASAIEAPLVLSVIRQESSFNAEAVSSAGARGLMQLMPGTAREVASKLGLPFAPQSLTLDPAYNLQLGQAYLARLLDSFAGSYVLALAGYNAGPGRVRQWLRENGDPRGDLAFTIDWIELIPFSETRNYVQRTIEGLHVYRNRLMGPSTPLLVHQDLTR